MKQIKNLLCLLAVIMTAQISVGQTVIIPGNAYAFQWSGDPDIGLYFSAANSRYEFRDLVGGAEWWCNPISGLTYHRNDVVIGAISNSNGRLEIASAGGNSSAVAARGLLSANGYMGSQGTADFDGILTLDILGEEVGVLGTSTGGSANDNTGVYGHSNGRGVYGEHSTSGYSSALGTLDNSIVANGPASINGNIDATGQAQFNISGFNSATAPGPFRINNGGLITAFDGNEVQTYSGGAASGIYYIQFYGGSTDIGFGGGNVTMGRGAGIVTMGLGTGNVTVASGSGDVGMALGGGSTSIRQAAGSARTEMELVHELGGPNNGIAFKNSFGDQNGWNLYTLSSGNLYFYQNDGATGTNTAEVVFSTDGAINTLSDARYKETIEPMGNTLEDLMKLEPKSYYYKHDRNRTTRSLGFMAQDIQEIFPDIVTENVIDENTGETQLMVTYSEFIPVIVAAMQEQEVKHEEELEAKNEEIDALNDRLDRVEALLARLDKDLSACCTSSSADVNSSERASLSQNIPNPFNGTTTINYYLPKDVSFATVKVVDINGSVVKEFNLQGEGFGQLTFASSELAGGNYFYSLFIDGEVVDTKQMNLVK